MGLKVDNPNKKKYICPRCNSEDGYFSRVHFYSWAIFDCYGNYTGDEGICENSYRVFKKKYCINCDKILKD